MTPGEQRRSDFKQVFGTDAGERVLRYLMRICCFVDGTIDPNPHLTAYNEGRRSAVLEILGWLEADLPWTIAEIDRGRADDRSEREHDNPDHRSTDELERILTG